MLGQTVVSDRSAVLTPLNAWMRKVDCLLSETAPMNCFGCIGTRSSVYPIQTKSPVTPARFVVPCSPRRTFSLQTPLTMFAARSVKISKTFVSVASNKITNARLSLIASSL